jgi:hypothetical protein
MVQNVLLQGIAEVAFQGRQVRFRRSISPMSNPVTSMSKSRLTGEKDEHRLTVHGLSYLRNLDRESTPETRLIIEGRSVLSPSEIPEEAVHHQ